MSSNRWLARQDKDPYVKQAKAAGYRARAAFKLLELDEKDRLLRPGLKVVDLGAAPGSWAQVAAEKVGESGRVIALDILPMDALPGVDIIEGDFREQDVLNELEARVGEQVDLVLSDMAPNLSGIVASDQARSMHLAELALDFARQWLNPKGRFVVKLFQGEGFDEFLRDARATFKAVRVRKPKSSRRESREVYLVGDALK